MQTIDDRNPFPEGERDAETRSRGNILYTSLYLWDFVPCEYIFLLKK
jgi:hypothetical protein